MTTTILYVEESRGNTRDTKPKNKEQYLEREIVQSDKPSNKTLLFDKMATTNQLAPPL